MPDAPPPVALYGRRRECDRLAALVADAHSGHSGVLVIEGEAGVGKSALLEHLVDSATRTRVLRVTGIEAERELPFSGLHQLCRPLLTAGLDHVPAPQADALGTALGLRAGTPPDRLLVGLAALSLLSEGASDAPLLCVVDDAQWLDQASTLALAFVAHRLDAEGVVFVIATRPHDSASMWRSLPRLQLEGLSPADAEALLTASFGSVLEEGVRDRVIAEARGNPLALLELPRWSTVADVSFGPRQGRMSTLGSRVRDLVRHELALLPEASRTVLVLAAAEPLGDRWLLHRAMEQLGLDDDALDAAEESGIVEVGERVLFRHPLVRAAVYSSGEAALRRTAHRTLAAVTDPAVDPDRRAWHLAQGASGPDDGVADELERSGRRAAARGGVAAAAAFLERSAALTADRHRRLTRQIDAVQALLDSGSHEAALAIADQADRGPLDERQRAVLQKLRAQIAFAVHGGGELPALLAAAQRLEAFDVDDALDLYVDLVTAALLGSRGDSGWSTTEVARAVLRAPIPATSRSGALLRAIALLYLEGHRAAVPSVQRALAAFDDDEVEPGEAIRLHFLAGATAVALWDEETWARLSAQHLDAVRRSGALSALPIALSTQAVVDVHFGNLASATRITEEARAFRAASGSQVPLYADAAVIAFRGNDPDAAARILDIRDEAAERNEPIGATMVAWAHAMLCNGLGRYRDAVAVRRDGSAVPAKELAVVMWWTIELVEAAVHAAEMTLAHEAFERLASVTAPCPGEWAAGITARSRALLAEGGDAEALYREAITLLAGTRHRPDLARARLLYGEWLRRQGRRGEARRLLRTAHDAFEELGMGAFADRARRELSATGERVRPRTRHAPPELTEQEVHIARLAAEGLTNLDIATELFISPRTVEWHLGKVFAKLGVTSRRDLGRLAGTPPT